MLSPRSSSGRGREVDAEGIERGLGPTDAGRDGVTDEAGRGDATAGVGRGDTADAMGRGLATAIEGVRDAEAGDGSAALKEDVPARESLIFFFSGCFSFSCAG